MATFFGISQPNRISQAFGALEALVADPERLARERERLDEPPPPYSSGESTELPSPSQDGQHISDADLRMQREREICSSTPANQFDSQWRFERRRLIDQSDRRFVRRKETLPSKLRVDLITNAEDNVKSRWIEQGIWNPEWTVNNIPGLWMHEYPAMSPREVTPKPEPLPLFGTAKAAPQEPQSLFGLARATSKKPASRVMVVSKNPARIEAHMEETQASRPYKQFQYQIKKEREWLEDEPDSAEMDLDAEAYKNVKERWLKHTIWNPKWNDYPGDRWMHEDLLKPTLPVEVSLEPPAIDLSTPAASGPSTQPLSILGTEAQPLSRSLTQPRPLFNAGLALSKDADGDSSEGNASKPEIALAVASSTGQEAPVSPNPGYGTLHSNNESSVDPQEHEPEALTASLHDYEDSLDGDVSIDNVPSQAAIGKRKRNDEEAEVRSSLVDRTSGDSISLHTSPGKSNKRPRSDRELITAESPKSARRSTVSKQRTPAPINDVVKPAGAEGSALPKVPGRRGRKKQNVPDTGKNAVKKQDDILRKPRGRPRVTKPQITKSQPKQPTKTKVSGITKKPRGRPAGTTQKPAATATKVEGASESPSKKARGRPPRAIHEPSTSVPESGNDDDVELPESLPGKSRRGRPALTAQQPTNKTSKFANKIPAPSAPKRSRGRPARTPVEQPQPQSSKSTKNGEIQPASLPLKKSRGRPSRSTQKPQPQSDSTLTSRIGTAVALNSSSPPAKKPRGRPPSSRPSLAGQKKEPSPPPISTTTTATLSTKPKATAKTKTKQTQSLQGKTGSGSSGRGRKKRSIATTTTPAATAADSMTANTPRRSGRGR